MSKQTVLKRYPAAYSELAYDAPGYLVRDPWQFAVIGRGASARAAWANAAAQVAA